MGDTYHSKETIAYIPEEVFTPKHASGTATLSLLYNPEAAAGLPQRLLEMIAPDFRPRSRYRTPEELARTAVLAGTMAVANVLVLDTAGVRLEAGETLPLGPEGYYVVGAKKPGQETLVPQYLSLGPEDTFMRASLERLMAARQLVAGEVARKGEDPYPDYSPVWELSAEARKGIPAEITHPAQLQMPATTLPPSVISAGRMRDSLSQQLRFVMDYLAVVGRLYPGATTDFLQAKAVEGIPAVEVAAGYPLGVARALMGAEDEASRKYRRGEDAKIVDTEDGPRFVGLEKEHTGTMCSAQSPHVTPEWFHPPANPISIINWHIRIASEVARYTLWKD